MCLRTCLLGKWNTLFECQDMYAAAWWLNMQAAWKFKSGKSLFYFFLFKAGDLYSEQGPTSSRLIPIILKFTNNSGVRACVIANTGMAWLVTWFQESPGLWYEQILQWQQLISSYLRLAEVLLRLLLTQEYRELSKGSVCVQILQLRVLHASSHSLNLFGSVE